MGTTADKLAYLQGTKAAIKSAIINKGVAVPDGTTFRGYADKIGDIIDVPDLSNPGAAGDLRSGKQLVGADGSIVTGALPEVTQATPSISVSSGGLITASATQSGGIVEGGTKSSTKQLTTQGEKTVTPTTTAQTAVASGRYTTGDVVVAGDANLVPENIAEGVSIFGVSGTHSGGGGELVNVELVAQYGYTNVDEGDPNAFWVYAQTEPGVYEVLRFNLGEVQNIQVVKNSTILGSVTHSFPSQVSGNAQILYYAKLQSMPGYDSYPILVYGDCGIVF